MTAPVFQADHLAVSVAARPLLRGVCFSLLPGQRLALSGPSGIGKSTLLRCLALLEDPSAGELLLRQQSPQTLGIPCYRRRVVYLAQTPVFPEHSVAKVLARPFHFQGTDRPFPAEEAQALLAALDVGHTWNQPARSLSVGEQQRVHLVRALLVHPDVVLLDEPTSALDEETTIRMEALLTRRCEETNLAAVIVTHHPEQARRWTHRQLDLTDHRAPASLGEAAP